MRVCVCACERVRARAHRPFFHLLSLFNKTREAFFFRPELNNGQLDRGKTRRSKVGSGEEEGGGGKFVCATRPKDCLTLV